jgi:hypothetical protein
MGAGSNVNFRMLALAVVLLVGVAPVSGSGRHISSKTKSPNGGYVLALATANRFLIAWQTGDLETGMVLLSDHARRSQTTESLEKVFSPDADRAFEIHRGLNERGCYRFPIVMVSRKNSRVHRKFSEIILTNTGKTDWAIEKLP